MRRRTLLAALSVLAFSPIAVLRLAAADLQPLEIATKSGVRTFAVEMALTPEEQARGLMFRRSLPEGQGMLFDFRREQELSFWMKNTLISLDMIFIRGTGRILRIAENTEPLPGRLAPSGGPGRAVLEGIAATAKKLGIAPGDRSRIRSSAGVSGRAPRGSLYRIQGRWSGACWSTAKRVSRG